MASGKRGDLKKGIRETQKAATGENLCFGAKTIKTIVLSKGGSHQDAKTKLNEVTRQKSPTNSRFKGFRRRR